MAVSHLLETVLDGVGDQFSEDHREWRRKLTRKVPKTSLELWPNKWTAGTSNLSGERRNASSNLVKINCLCKTGSERIVHHGDRLDTAHRLRKCVFHLVRL
ncbi:unannotated protein [freshwater metagenome]|uniref:Unannotated protein n=1 Tax=freshwater metagenome TaxID=449393 RepID=A0A6J6FZR9_9ZZZZ